MTTAPEWTITRSAQLPDDVVGRIRALAGDVAASDGAPPLDEHAELRLDAVHDDVEHLVLDRAGSLLGYAQVDHAATGGAGAEILVALNTARADVANALLGGVETAVAEDAVLVWARGDRTPVRAAAEARGYHAVRTLLTMSRPLAGLDSTGRDLPVGVSIRAFVPGQDDAAWLGVNSRAFAEHPEQGRWTQSDLDDRIVQPWFDPAGFLLLVDSDGTVLGFHWTKVHPPTPPHAARPVAEVYVIGLDPAAQGRGMGRALLTAGLAHLQGSGADTVILYTDADNHAAVRLYQATGFTIVRREVQYRRPA